MPRGTTLNPSALRHSAQRQTIEEFPLSKFPRVHPAARYQRRGFLKIAAAGAGVAALGTLAGSTAARAADGNVEALLLCCMDYRLVDDVTRYMDGRGLTNKYDQVILAGASLGAMNDQFSAWGTAFFDHVQVALDLHKISKVMIMDHRDCGAYKVILGQDFGKDFEAETAIHAQQLQKVGEEIARRFPGLGVELLLMSLDGSVEVISGAPGHAAH
jgi:hypothetical protein